MKPTRELLDEIERERIERARRMHPLDKALAGADLFDAVCERMMLGIEMDMPDEDESVKRHELRRRLAKQVH